MKKEKDAVILMTLKKHKVYVKWYVFKMSEMASSLLFLSFDYAINLSY